MKRFQFKLQTVLDFREKQLDQVQQILAAEEKKKADLLNQLHEIDLVIEQSMQDQQENLSQSTVDPTLSRLFPHYLMKLKQDRFQVYRRVLAQEDQLNRVRLEVQQALIKKKSLEMLKSKQEKDFLKKVESAEAAFLDEIALNRKYRESKRI